MRVHVAPVLIIAGSLAGSIVDCTADPGPGSGGAGGASTTSANPDAPSSGSNDPCAPFAARAAVCCAQPDAASGCPTNPGTWAEFCAPYAKGCTSLPTCFTTTDCAAIVNCQPMCP